MSTTDGSVLAVDTRISSLSEAQRSLLLERRPGVDEGLGEEVAALLHQVRESGDDALREMARRYDGVELEELEIPRNRWSRALAALDPDVRLALEEAARNVEIFHKAQIPDRVEVPDSDGVVLGRDTVPLARAGVYVPGGRAAYPSSVIMGVVPARAAGVREIVVCSPPGPDGLPPREVLAACAVAGADRLFALGGAGAIGALAFGTASVPRADVIVGPGNRWVTEAKRQIAGEVPIDGPAGPSEVLVVAEESSVDPVWVAAELVAQAEHDPDAAVAFVTPSEELLDAVRQALVREVEAAPRAETVRAALGENGALLLASSLAEALDFAEEYAPEHLALYTEDPRRDLPRIRNAGTVFLGPSASVAFGDYLTGANHVLPTGGRARSFSGLSTEHFLRSFTWQEIDPDGARSLSEPVRRLAEAEGLPAHARAAVLRSGGSPSGDSPGGEDSPGRVRP